MSPTVILLSGLVICVSNAAFAQPVESVRDAVRVPKTPVLTQRQFDPRRASRGGRGMPGDWKPGARAGGDTPTSATVIPVTPHTYLNYSDVGNNALNTDAGMELCPDTIPGPEGGRDAWYTLTAVEPVWYTVAITLCDVTTDFDTRLYVYEGSVTPGAPVKCDDDTCSAGLGFPWVSVVVFPWQLPPNQYWIVVDGWSESDTGDYLLTLQSFIDEPCLVNCLTSDVLNPGPCLLGGDGDDGCFAPNQDEFFAINCEETVCGTFFTDSVNNLRDLDWYELVLTQTNDVTALLISDPSAGHQLAFHDPIRAGCAPPGDDQPVTLLVSTGDACSSTGFVLTGLTPGAYWFAASMLSDPDDPARHDCPNAVEYRLRIACDCGPYLEGNANGDAVIDFDDLNAVLGAWGSACGQ